MAIKKINTAACNGCGACVNSCPMDVIRMDKKSQKAIIAYPDDCMVCCYCEHVCPTNAIHLTPEILTLPPLGWG